MSTTQQHTGDPYARQLAEYVAWHGFRAYVIGRTVMFAVPWYRGTKRGCWVEAVRTYAEARRALGY